MFSIGTIIKSARLGIIISTESRDLGFSNLVEHDISSDINKANVNSIPTIFDCCDSHTSGNVKANIFKENKINKVHNHMVFVVLLNNLVFEESFTQICTLYLLYL